MRPWGRSVRVAQVGDRCPVCHHKFLVLSESEQVVAVSPVASLWGATQWRDANCYGKWWSR